MAKTPLLTDTLDRLSALNDQLCYMTFADQEIEGLLRRIDRNPEAFTGEAFPDNPRAARIYVRLKELTAFRHLSLATGFGAIVVASYETVAGYMSQAQSLLETLGQFPPVVTPQDTPEDTFQAALTASRAVPLDREVLETIAYLRLRRNQLSHARETPGNALATLVRQRGTHLDRFWGHPAPVLAAPPTAALSESEAIGLLKLLRISTQTMDGAVAPALDPRKVIMSLDADLLSAQPQLRDPARYDERIRKLDTLAGMLYGLDDDARPIITPP
jgi:hypothetical protein